MIPNGLTHEHAMHLQAVELERTVAMLRSLSEDAWSAQTDCPSWDVRRMYLHVLGACEAGASIRESVRQFVSAAASELGFDLVWKGKGRAEHGVDRKTGKTIVALDPRYLRPTEVDTLLGDARKARKELGWKPRVSFDALVREMAREDLAVAERESLVKNAGYASHPHAAD